MVSSSRCRSRGPAAPAGTSGATRRWPGMTVSRHKLRLGSSRLLPFGRMLRRGAWIAAGLLCAGVVALSSSRLVALRTPAVSNASVPGVRPAASDTEGQPAADEPRSRPFRVPAGHAPSLSCDAARAIVAQARDQLGYVPAPVDARALSEAAADWLDPYGLWTVAPDAPVSGVFNRRA